PKLCPVEAETDVSFTNETVPLAEGMQAQPATMQPGDVLFFNGQVIHGSGPNTSDRFRRALIAHYVVGDAQKVAEFYHPLLTFDGQEVALGTSEHGGPCGVWVDKQGQQVLEMQAAKPS
ncbi:MAG: phytanoyl-CoA dioxygenase family protein, partial [Deinococcota bacterium]